MRSGWTIKSMSARGLTGRIILLVIVAVIAGQATSIAFFADERSVAIRAAARDQILARTASMVRLLEETPIALHDRVLSSVSSNRLSFWTTPERRALKSTTGRSPNPIDATLTAQLMDMMGDGRPVTIVSRGHEHSWIKRMRERFDDDDDDDDDEHFRKDRGYGDGKGWGHKRGWRKRPPLTLSMTVEVREDLWLNVESRLPSPRPPWGRAIIWSLIIVGILSLVAVHMAKRVTRPLSNLTIAAEKAGRGEAIDPVPVEGPEDLRATIQAFNRMHERLDRFVKDRMQMLAALSHDLRTPITVLRLRVELLEDEETKSKMLATLDEMQRMAEETLAYAREEAAREDTRAVDLFSLLDSLCSDLIATGREITLTDGGRLDYECRPLALKRAINNIIENACIYGERAWVELVETDTEIAIVIDDDGPGIPEDSIEEMFRPFVRFEDSRNMNTGGIGLGLAIARGVLRGHGGDITLQNRAEGGLRVQISLPKALH